MKNTKVVSSVFMAMCVAFILCATLIFAGCGESDEVKAYATMKNTQITMVLGQTQNLEFEILPESISDKSYTLSSNNIEIVRVLNNTTISAVGVGSATVTLTLGQSGNRYNVAVTVVEKATNLAVPQNITFDGEKVVWDNVANRTGYAVRLNGEILQTTYSYNSFRDFAIGEKNTIQIKAVGNNSAYLDSAWSQEFVFTKLVAPIVEISNKTVLISSQYPDATYNLYMDGILLESNLNQDYYINSDELGEGTHTFKAVTIGDQTQNIYNSTFSDEKSITKLNAPTNAVISSGILSFNAVSGAERYLMLLKNTQTNNETTIEITKDNFDLSQLGDTYIMGQCEIRLKSVGNRFTTLDSNYSISIAITKLNAPTNVKIANGIVRWERDFVYKNGFTVNIYNYTSQRLQSFDTMEQYYNFGANYIDAGVYGFTVVARGDDLNSQNIKFTSSEASSELLITKLDVPTSLQIADNKLTWNEVENATAYEILDGASNAIQTQTLYFNFLNSDESTFETGSHSVRLKVLGNGAEILDSEYSKPINFVKLGSVGENDFTITESTVSWKSVANCMTYRVFINDYDAVETNINSIDLSEYEDIVYNFAVQAISDTSNYVMGEKSSIFSFQKVGTPSDLFVENGILTWQAPSLNSIITSYRIRVISADGTINIYNTGSVTTQNNMNNYMVDGTTGSVSVQAICSDSTNSFMWGNFSQEVQLTKLSSNFEATIENGILSWNKIVNANNYLLTISHQENGQTVSQTTKFENMDNPHINLYETLITPSTYSITLQSTGATGGQNLSSKISSAITITKLDSIQNFKLVRGVLSWDYDEYVSFYEVLVDDISLGKIGKISSYELPYNVSVGTHNIEVIARGNGVDSLDADNSATVVVTKLQANFNIWVDKEYVRWDKIENASGYAVELRDSSNNIVQIYDVVTDNFLSFEGINPLNVFYFRIKALGSTTNADSEDTKFVNSNYSANNGASYYEINMLENPSNVSIDEGILTWQYVANTSNYLIKVASQNVSEEEIEFKREITDTNIKGSFNLAEYVSKIGLAGSINVSVRAIGSIGQTAYMSSLYSTVVTTYKLDAPSISTTYGVLTWAEIGQAQDYDLTITDAGQTNNTITINTTEYELNSNYGGGCWYNICVRANGDGKTTLSSESSQVYEVYKLESLSQANQNFNIAIKNGKIVWTPIDNAYQYQLTVSERNAYGEFNEYLTDYIMSGTNSYLFNASETAVNNEYKISIKVIAGSNDKYLNSDQYNYLGTLIKLSAPTNLRVDEGKMAWTGIMNRTSNGYALNFNGNERKVGAVESFVLDNSFQAMNYNITAVSLGDNTIYLTSDASNSLMVSKLASANLSIRDYQVSWTSTAECDYYEYYIVNLESGRTKTGQIESSPHESYSVYDFQDLPSGYYSIKMRYVAGSFTIDDSQAFVSSDWTNEFNVYKLDTPEDFGLDNDFSATNQNAGTLKWGNPLYANNFKISYNSSTQSYRVYDVDTSQNMYDLSADLYNDGTYNVSIYSYYYNDYTQSSMRSLIFNGNSMPFGVVKSDDVKIDVTKLAVPTDICVQNGVTYWQDPDMGDIQNSIQFRYAVYVAYSNTSNGLENAEYVYNYASTGSIHNVANKIVRGFELSDLGYYKVSVRAYGVNCIRSDIVECELYHNYLQDSQKFYFFDLFSGGNGTEQNPYILKTFNDANGTTRTLQEQFDYVNYLYSKAFILKENLTLDSEYSPIGSKDELSDDFNGVFDGGHYTIDASSVVFDKYTNVDANAGIFNALSENAVIKDLTIQGFNVEGYYSYNKIGAVAGQNAGTISNVIVKESDTQNAIVNNTYNLANYMYVGGVVGLNSGIIENCITYVTLNPISSNAYSYVGGIVGYNEGLVQNSRTCAVAQLLSATQLTGTLVGGIAGYNYGDNAVIYASSNYANIYARESGTNSQASGRAGGIVGMNKTSSSVDSSTEHPQIINCYNVGSVIVHSSAYFVGYAGGLVGNVAGGMVANSYNAGTVSIDRTDSSGAYGQIYGIISSDISTISNCYNVASVSDEQTARTISDLNIILDAIEDENGEKVFYIIDDSTLPILSWEYGLF